MHKQGEAQAELSLGSFLESSTYRRAHTHTRKLSQRFDYIVSALIKPDSLYCPAFCTQPVLLHNVVEIAEMISSGKRLCSIYTRS